MTVIWHLALFMKKYSMKRKTVRAGGSVPEAREEVGMSTPEVLGDCSEGNATKQRAIALGIINHGIRRTFETAAHTPNELFDYTSGRWLANDALRLSERRTVFNVAELRLLAAQSVGRSSSDILSFTKLAECGCNRSFLITMRDGFKMIARIPYPHNQPSYYLLASEVATMDYLRSVVGIPTPDLYGYSAGKDNAAETEYIFMEYVRGSELRDVSSGFGERDIVSVVRQLVQLEAKMMSVQFPAGGSLYYACDLEKIGAGKGIPMPDDARFCIGPDLRPSLWHGRRESQIEVNRGPYETMVEALVRGAHKELVFLERFGQPLFPLDRSRREAYNYQEQHPSDHTENLNRYLLIAPSLVSPNPTLGSFRIRHPDLTHEGNILVSRTADSVWEICSLIDWQYASILPISLLAGIPDSIRNLDGDDEFDPKRRPSLPPDFTDLSDSLRGREMANLRRRLKHYQYFKDTEEWNPLHHAALMDPHMQLRQDLFHESSFPWQGEPLPLKRSLIQATREWDALAGPAAGPCPIAFHPEDVAEADRWQREQAELDLGMILSLSVVGCERHGSVPNERFEEVLLESKKMKDILFSYLETPQERTDFLAHWFLEDMDEEPYM
ncbi:protein kinase subdomain-containing protein PKL/CAK/Fmp29 [Roridomyces roridus]|uniref:Protein kinase subdomain-containing protein PKL/CAK/Fmp29 n=1 Tax=Roridomyces roridus TaxID=1738132 RepID=A0AAD7B0W7_9AGAR|nr:protein kinase subdomain-containing protein PKL/CAK/Fmp29 [Roridomyces roridus]